MHYIDFHVHAFTEKIAARTIAALAATCGGKPLTDGTLAGTRRAMKDWGVDGAVLMSIATKPSQHLVCNNWAASCKGEGIFPFGSVHPDGEDALSELCRIKELGLYGIKLHPDYQDFFVDEQRIYPIYQKCGELGLPVLLHAGVDPVSPDVVHCKPGAAAKAVADNPGTTFILAHLGGNAMWEEAEVCLAGKFPNLYLDTALAGSYTDSAVLLRMIRKQGADRVLLASDCPWDSTRATIDKIESLDLTKAEKHAVFAENAEKLLGLSF